MLAGMSGELDGQWAASSGGRKQEAGHMAEIVPVTVVMSHLRRLKR